jgi:hypothetical protein
VALFAAMMGVLIVPSAAFGSARWSAPMSVDSVPVVSVSCPSASFCAAVDVNGNTVTFNGSSWSAPASIDGTNVLSSVSCPSASFCAAVDVNGNAVSYNGSSWSAPSSIDSGHVLSSVSCPSSSFCVAVDSVGREVTFNGSSWSAPASIDGTNVLSSVSCPSASFCAAVDRNGNAVTFNGSSWGAPTSIDGTHTLSSVSCPSAAFCAAVDVNAYALTYNGSSWSAPIPVVIAELRSVSCPSVAFCIAVDPRYALPYDGFVWGYVGIFYTIDSAGLRSVSCPSAAFCAAVDDAGNALIYSTPPPSPSNTSRPTISGSAVQRQLLTEAHGSWTNNPTRFSYQWEDCNTSGGACSAISNATSQAYLIQASDVGHTIRIQETASNTTGSSRPASSAPTAVVVLPVRAALSRVLVPGGKLAKIGVLLRHGGYSISFNAPSAGRLAILWYLVREGAKRKQPVLIAKLSVSFHQAGAAKIKIILTRNGRRLLAHAKQLTVTAQGTFTPNGKPATKATKRFRLKR